MGYERSLIQMESRRSIFQNTRQIQDIKWKLVLIVNIVQLYYTVRYLGIIFSLTFSSMLFWTSLASYLIFHSFHYLRANSFCCKCSIYKSFNNLLPLEIWCVVFNLLYLNKLSEIKKMWGLAHIGNNRNLAVEKNAAYSLNNEKEKWRFLRRGRDGQRYCEDS